MNRTSFPFVALAIGGILMVILVVAGDPVDETQRRLPLLTLLIISEFGLFLTAFGAWSGIGAMRTKGFSMPALLPVAGCVLLSMAFLVLGVRYWPL